MFLLFPAAGTLHKTFNELQEGLMLFDFALFTVGLTPDQKGKTKRPVEGAAHRRESARW